MTARSPLEALAKDVEREARRAPFDVCAETYARAGRDPNVPILCAGSVSARFFRYSSARFTTPWRILVSTGLCCSISRLMLSGKSSESTRPFRKRSHCGNSSSQWSVMKTRFT